MLSDKVTPAVCAGVVKADAYGLGLEPVARRLWREDVACTSSRPLKRDRASRHPGRSGDYAANGLLPGEEAHYREHRLFPTLNDLGQVALVRVLCVARRLPAVLHVDTGMSRLGLSVMERTRLQETPDLISASNVAI